MDKNESIFRMIIYSDDCKCLNEIYEMIPDRSYAHTYFKTGVFNNIVYGPYEKYHLNIKVTKFEKDAIVKMYNLEEIKGYHKVQWLLKH